MKKLEIVRILAAAILIGGVISIPLINNHTAYKVEKALCEIPLPEETELIESLSQAGKLTGNGNGMQYFGAILIRSELSLEELETYYSDYRSNEWECLVETILSFGSCLQLKIKSVSTDTCCPFFSVTYVLKFSPDAKCLAS